MSAEFKAVMVIVPRSNPETVAANTNVRDRLIADTHLSPKTILDQVSPQKIEALRCRVEMEQAKQELTNYLHEGEQNWHYKNNEVRYVEASKMRELTLRAGYTEFALGVMPRFGVTDLSISRRFPAPNKDPMTIKVSSPNRYGLRPATYDAIDAVDWLINTQKPDYPSGRDPLRQRVLREIKEVEGIKQGLYKNDRGIFSLSAWDMGLAGKVHFLLNPGYAKEADFGWYTVRQLRGWVNGNPRSTVLKENQKVKERKEKRHYWKTRYAEHLGRLSKRTDKEGERLFRMALMDCPFEDLIEKYYRPTI